MFLKLIDSQKKQKHTNTHSFFTIIKGSMYSKLQIQIPSSF